MSMNRNDALAQLANGLRKFEGMTAVQILDSGWNGLKGLQQADFAFFKANAEKQAKEVALACQSRGRYA